MANEFPAVTPQEPLAVRLQDALEKKGFDPLPQDIETMTISSEARGRYSKEIMHRRQESGKLRDFASFTHLLKTYSMPALNFGHMLSIKHGGTEDLSKIDHKHILEKASLLGADVSEATGIIFGDQNNPGLISRTREIWKNPTVSINGVNRVLTQRQREVLVGQEIASAYEKMFNQEDNSKILPLLLSSERTIPIDTSQGKVLASPKDLFIQKLDAYPEMLAILQDSLTEAIAENPEMATYDAYQWIRQAIRIDSHILPTPATEHVLSLINLSHEKRNGLLKYILLGEAGVGKTRLIIEDNKRRNKDTVVLNFHEFITFDELIGHTAMTVNLGGSSNTERLQKAVEKYANPSQTEDSFWSDMQNVYDNLPNNLKNQFVSSEQMVGQMARTGGDMFDNNGQETTESMDKTKIRSEFQQRLKALYDMSLLGIDSANEGDLQSRWVQGAILKAIQEGKVVCFDELDKAGKYAIDGMLSFLSNSPGETWEYQGGKVKIPKDFWISATSNNNQIDASSGTESMNRFLADRCEQILVRPQPIKDALMLAGVLLSNDNGQLLLNKEDQIYLINAYSYILPRLQKAGIGMPVTNRIFQVFCSRLVNHKDMEDGSRHYFRNLDKSGNHVRVKEALRLSLVTMKQMSLSTDDMRIVEEVLTDYEDMVGQKEINEFGDDIDLDILDIQDNKSYLTKRAGALSEVWEQPLYSAIGALSTDKFDQTTFTLQAVDDQFLQHPNWQEILDSSPLYENKIMGRMNGVELLPNSYGIDMVSYLGKIEIGRRQAVQGDYANAIVTSADELGEVFLVKKGAKTEVIAYGKSMLLKSGAEPIFVDPKRRYIVCKTPQGMSIQAIAQKSEDHSFYLSNVYTADQDAKVADITTDGSFILLKDVNGLQILDLRNLSENSKTIRVQSYPLETKWSNGKFIGGHLVLGLDENNRVAVNQDGRIKPILLTY